MKRLMDTVEFRNILITGSAGCRLKDADGREFIDFFTDVGTASMGYDGPLHDQALFNLATSHLGTHAPNLFPNKLRNDVSESICRLMGMDRVFWCNSGSEAVEAAIKMARKFQHDRGRSTTIWSFAGGFHGRTMGALTAGDGAKYHYDGFGPFPLGFQHFSKISDIDPKAAAVILAPVFGNNDVVPYPDGWLAELSEFTTKNGMLLIFDEVQTGSGRTGAPTFAQKIGVKPDIITLAKGIGMGCPVGVTLARGEVGSTFTPGVHFSTFGGNPLACAFVKVVVDWLSKDENLRGVEEKGEKMRHAMAALPGSTNVRGVGMLNAFDVPVDRKRLEAECMDEGLILPSFRTGPGPVKITPTLNITSNDLSDGLNRLEDAYRRCPVV